MTYNWQQKDWPEFTFDYSKIEEKLFVFAQKSGRISGKLDGLDEEAQSDAIIELLNNEPKRKFMGNIGKRRIKNVLNWDKQKENLFRAYSYLNNC